MDGVARKVIVITGGCGDIGSATTRRLAEGGAMVVSLDIFDADTGSERARSAGAALYIQCDQARRDQLSGAIDLTVATFGRIDAIIINAAVVEIAPFEEMTSEAWQRQIDVNLTGAFYAAQEAAKTMLAQRPDALGVRGRILFTSSWVAEHPLPGSTAYIATKGALNAMMRAMAQELASRGVRVNCVAPGLLFAGLTRTLNEHNPESLAHLRSMVPLGELGTSEQVADSFAFLCSDGANYITGHNLTVDGGCSVINRRVSVEDGE